MSEPPSSLPLLPEIAKFVRRRRIASGKVEEAEWRVHPPGGFRACDDLKAEMIGSEVILPK